MNAHQEDHARLDNPGFARLTARELDCLRALRDEGQAKPAARALAISLETFNEHLSKARRKLGVARSWTAARLLAEWEAAQVTPTPAPDIVAPAVQGDERAPTPRSGGLLEDVFARLGPWSGPLLVVLTAAGLAVAAIVIWATAELALRFQSLQ